MSNIKKCSTENKYKPTTPQDARFKITAILHEQTYKNAYTGKQDIKSLSYEQLRDDYNNLNCGLRIAYAHMGENNPYKNAKASPDKPYKELLEENPKLYKKLEEEHKSMKKEAELQQKIMIL
ncbi:MULTISPECIES: hypothetical protein [Campylobacter]|uniref:hypothetical protein n=1 Tax=Campylobacter TaxID=194 RepID=UPI0023F19F12|nr:MULTISPECIES: hypothetical protein [Campylobacter]MCI6641464.1 hypothetical protein [Campylobacter sp.]MDD7422144.1 hypothetical protein [Campylobacter hominis]MDY3117805.1 hypothetical protein [Campylobacter hominis]